MDDRGATEFPFVIRDVISTATPQELKEAMATQSVTVSRMAGADGQDEFWCAQLMQPVQRRVEMVDHRARYDADYVGVDAVGPYVWTHYVALRPHDAGAFGPGAQGVAADFAFVVDLSLGADTFFDSSKVDWVATVIIDGGADAEVLDTESDPSQHAEREPEPDENGATGARLRWEIAGLIDGTDADCRRTDGDQWVPPSGCGTRGDRCLLTEPSLALRRRSTALRLKSPVVQRLVSVRPYGSRDGAPLRFRAGRGASPIDLQASAMDRPEGDRPRARRRRVRSGH